MFKKKHGKIAFLTYEWPLRDNFPTLVFIHSSGLTSQMWDKQLTGLSTVANTIAVDLPGHGDSDPPGMETMKDYAAAVAELIRELKAPNPIPCGLSIGGGIVQQMLLDHADCAVAGILIGTGGRLRVASSIFETIENNYADFVPLMEKYSFSPTATRECIENINEIMRSCPPEVATGDFKACHTFDVMNRLNEIEQPVLIISGADDQLTPGKYADFLEREIRSTTRVHLENAGHMMPNEHPEQVNAAIRAFVEELDLA